MSRCLRPPCHIYQHSCRLEDLARLLLHPHLLSSTLLQDCHICHDGTFYCSRPYLSSIGNFTCAQFKAFPGIVNKCPQPLQNAASVLFVMFSIVNITSDFALTLMACTALWQAKLPTPTKISAALLLCLGSMGGVASSIRLAIWFEPADIAKYTQETLALVRWILIELAFSVIAANLALTRPLFHSLMVKVGLITQIGTTNATHQSAGGARNPLPKSARSASDGDERLLSDSKRGITVVVDTEMTRMSHPKGPIQRVEQF